MNLDKKYRPETYEEVIGNEGEIKALQQAIENKKSQAFLLTGPAGCGKTTLARIAAKQLKADDLSIREINSANNRGVDTAREIIKQMTYIPPTGILVYIIDEAHKTTKDFQDAMLKPLEEPPPHVYFFLCTTDPQKLIKTVKDRCTKITVTAQEDETIYRFLRRIGNKEGVEISKELLREIAENCTGSPRVALKLLDKIRDIKDEKEAKEIISMGEEAEKEVIDLCRALINNNPTWSTIKGILSGLKDVDVEKIRYAVLGYMNAVLLKSNNKRAAIIIECFSDPFYNNGRAGLTLACFQSINSG
jgi:DNA polymerase-3 subunit gamma/tau